MAERSLTTIARLAQEIFKALPDGTEKNKAFKIWQLAGPEGDARTLSDEPTVKAAKKRGRKRT